MALTEDPKTRRRHRPTPRNGRGLAIYGGPLISFSSNLVRLSKSAQSGFALARQIFFTQCMLCIEWKDWIWVA